MDKKKITFLIICIISSFAIIIGVIIFINLFPDFISSEKEASAITIIGGDDGPITIYITAKYNWKFTLIISLLLLILDFIFLAIINVIERIKQKKIKLIYKSIIIFAVNILFSVLLFPGVFVWSLIITAIMIIFIIFTDKLKSKR
jgi:Na+-transporting methylmalonyl-CoA/oxaloacetate decarboxylase beta subunit